MATKPQKQDSHGDAAKRFFHDHPTLLLTFCYFIITVIGVVYYHYFYIEFGINIIKFSDLSDFLLVSVLEPRSLLTFIGVVIAVVVIYRADLWIRKWFRSKSWSIKRKLPLKYVDLLTLIFILGISTDTLTEELAVENAKEIKAGVIDEYMVRIADQSVARSLALLGSSSRFVYLYDVKKASAMVVPVESISYMRKKQTQQ
jgi:hypothetical protein